MKPRLLIILNRLAIGGPAMNTLAMASALSDEFDILCIAGKPLSHEHTAEHLLKLYTGFKLELIEEFKREVFFTSDYAAYKKIRSVIRHFKPDIVHTHGSKPGIIGRWAAHRMKVPLIIHTYHGHVFHGYFSKIVSTLIVYLERYMSRITDIIIAINKQIEYDLLTQYHIAPSKKVQLIPLGLDIQYYTKKTSQTELDFRKQLGLSKDDLVIGTIGRLVPVKQHSLYIQIAIKLLREYPQIPFRFLIVGDGSERDNLLQMISLAGFTYNVGDAKNTEAPFTFLLWRTDIPDILSAVDIVLHTSVNEGTPVSILEAMAMGKPVVATPVGGIPELFRSADAGFASADERLLIKCILQLGMDDQMRQEWGEKARSFILEKMTIDQQTDTFRRLIREKLSA